MYDTRVINSIPTVQASIVPPSSAVPTQSATRAYGQTHDSFGSFPSYYQIQNPLMFAIDSCSINNCNSGTESQVWFNTQDSLSTVTDGTNKFLKYNTDPETEQTINVCLECQIKNIISQHIYTVTSSSFSVTLTCPTNLELFEPADFVSPQLKLNTHIIASWPYFEFKTFLSKTKACSPSAYEIIAQISTFPVVKSYCEISGCTVPVSGTILSNTFILNVIDGENPIAYDFTMKITTNRGETTMPTSGTYRLQAQCPTDVEVYPITALGTSTFVFQTFKGADANTIPQNIYDFPKYSTKLPKCQQILGYSIVQTGSSLQYPSAYCTADPCTLMDIDTSNSGQIYFKIQATTSVSSGNTNVSPQIYIDITETYQTPSITASVPQTQSMLLDSTDKYVFDPFVCSSGCQITTYKISSSNLNVSPITGLGTISKRDSDGKLEFTVEKSALITYNFYVYSELDGLSSIFTFSQMATISIVCGLEQISSTVSSFSKTFQKGIGTQQFSEFLSWFSSNKPLCPLLHYTSIGPSFSLQNGFDLSNAFISVPTSSPIKASIALYGHSQAVQSSPVSIEFIVCGNEQVTNKELSTSYHLKQKGQSFQLDFSDWWTVTNSDSSECETMQYRILGSGCTGSAKAQFSVSGNQIQIDTANALARTSVCLEAETKGGVKGTQVIEVEVCGDETISLSGDVTSVSQVYLNQNAEAELKIKDEKVFFQSSRDSCPVFKFELVKSDQTTLYSGSSLTLEGQYSFEDLKIKVDSSQALDLQVFIKASSQTSTQFVLLPVNIHVCGYETIKEKKKYPDLFYMMNSGEKLLEVRNFEKYIDNNNTVQCPINDYKLLDSNKWPADQSEYRLEYQNSKEILVIYTNYTSTTNIIKIYFLQTTTMGKKTYLMPIKITFISPSQLTTFNLPPVFATLLSDITIQLDEGDYPSGTESVSLPEIVDESPATVQVEFQNAPSFVKYKFNNGKWQANIDLSKIKKIEQKVEILLKDSMGSETEYTQMVTVEIFEVSEFCAKGAKLISYRFDCEETASEIAYKFCKEVLVNVFYLQSNTQVIDRKLKNRQYKQSEEIQTYIKEIANGEFFFFTVPIIKADDDKLISYAQSWHLRHLLTKEIQYEAVKSTKTRFDLVTYESKICVYWFTDKLRNKMITSAVDDVSEKILNGIAEYDEVEYNLQDIMNDTLRESLLKQGLEEIYVNTTNPLNQVETQIDSSAPGYIVIESDAPTFKYNFKQDPQLGIMILSIKFSKEMFVPDDQQSQEDMIFEILQLSVYCGLDQELIVLGQFVNSQGRILEETEEDLAFSWSIYQFDTKNLLIKVDFKNEELISQNGDPDLMVFEFQENSIFVGLGQNPKSFEGDYLKPKTSIIRPIYSMSDKISLKSTFNTLMNAGAVVVVMTLSLGIFAGASLQALWGLFDTQQLSIHFILVNVLNIPGNAFVFQLFISDMNMRVQYQDILLKVQGIFFEFSETETPIENFERLNYEGTNFIQLSGSLLVNLLCSAFLVLLINGFNHCAKRSYKKFCLRKTASVIPFDLVNSGLTTLFKEGYLELLIPIIIQLCHQTIMSKSDQFAVRTAYVMLGIVVIIPIAISYFTWKNRNNLDIYVFEQKYGFLYSEYQTKYFVQYNFLLIYILRRVVFSIVIVFLSDYPSLQLVSILYLNIVYLGYFVSYQPMRESENNKTEIFNELCIQLITYMYMAFNQSLSANKVFGTIYIWIYIINIIINLGIIVYGAIKAIQGAYKTLKDFWNDKKYEKHKQRWFNDKKRVAENNPEDNFKQFIYQEAKKIMEKEKKESQDKKDKESYINQYKWLKINDLPTDCLEFPCSKSVKFSINDFKQGQVLPLQNMLGQQYPHNTTKAEVPPYEEKKYLECIESFAKKNNIKNENQPLPKKIQKHLQKILRITKKVSLYSYLTKNKYRKIKIENNGDCIAKAISIRVFGEEKRHDEVREQVCEEINLKQDKDENYITEMAKQGTLFTSNELQIAADLYKTPIIVFSPNHKMAFFDQDFPFFSSSSPIYLLDSLDGYFDPIYHASQNDILRPLVEQGLRVIKFDSTTKQEKYEAFIRQTVEIKTKKVRRIVGRSSVNRLLEKRDSNLEMYEVPEAADSQREEINLKFRRQ